MNEDVQKQFVSWLAGKLQAKDEQDLKAKMQQMGSQGIKQAYQAFMQEQQGAAQGGEDTATQGVQAQRLGGKLDYIRCLQAFRKGGKMEMDKCGCGAKLQQGGTIPEPKPVKDYVKKHQAGGITGVFDPNKSVTVTKDNGSESNYWGNNIKPQAVPMIGLHPTTTGPQQISEQQLQHLRGLPDFNTKVGQPLASRPGEQPRYGPDQSDMIRKLIVAYPMNAMPMGQQIVGSHAKGGKVSDHAMGSRKDTNVMGHKKASMSDTKLMEHSQGERSDSGFKEHSQGTRKDHNTMGHKKDSRKDQEKMSWQTGSRKEDNKKKKDYVGFAKKGMTMDKCQDGGEVDTQKKGGKVSAADKKVIMMKKMDAQKKQMGGSMSAQPSPTPANASQRMAGKGKGKKSMQPASYNGLGGQLGE